MGAATWTRAHQEGGYDEDGSSRTRHLPLPRTRAAHDPLQSHSPRPHRHVTADAAGTHSAQRAARPEPTTASTTDDEHDAQGVD